VVLRNTAVVIVLALACGAAARAQVIYTCIDAQGRQRASDGPIAECSDREQRVLNKDGSVRRIIAPITAYEAAEREALERKSAEERSRYDDAVRRDRNLKNALPPCPRGPSSDWPPAWPAACPTATQYQG